MVERMKITIGTRGSKLALVQTDMVAAALRAIDASLQIEVKVIVTRGDVNQAPIPLDTIGKSWFSAEIEEGLVKGDIDLAVHSLKDVAPESPSGLDLIPVLQREDPSDVLVSKTDAKLAELKGDAIVGTDSSRRQAQILELRPDVVVKSIRGNVDTRLRKLREEEYDAIVIAAAGLLRLGLGDEITELFDPTKFVPAPGQAALAAQYRSDDTKLSKLLNKLVHEPSRVAVDSERTFSRAVGGGCKLPVGCFARIDEKSASRRIEIFGMAADDAGVVHRNSVRGAGGDAGTLARELARRLGF